MATEIEMKLAVSSADLLDRLLKAPSLTQYMKDDYEHRRMRSTYYDTADGRLNQNKWTLRMRDEGGVLVAAFKTQNRGTNDGFFTRGEWQCHAESIEEAIPALVEQGAPFELLKILQEQRLQPVCGADFSRTSACLYMDDGVRIEMAGDLGYLFNGEKKEPICELELELIYGDAGSLLPICEELCEEYDLSEESKSKYERAKALGDN